MFTSDFLLVPAVTVYTILILENMENNLCFPGSLYYIISIVRQKEIKRKQMKVINEA